jgi:DNA-binding transcriptional ArsR family regulator
MARASALCNVLFVHRSRSMLGPPWRRLGSMPALGRRWPSPARPRRAVDPFEALADPTRRGILELLRLRGLATAGEIADAFAQISRPAVSRHLRVLREAGVVMADQRGREWQYRIDAAGLAAHYRDFFERFAPMWEDALQRLKRQVEDAL